MHMRGAWLSLIPPQLAMLSLYICEKHGLRTSRPGGESSIQLSPVKGTIGHLELIEHHACTLDIYMREVNAYVREAYDTHDATKENAWMYCKRVYAEADEAQMPTAVSMKLNEGKGMRAPAYTDIAHPGGRKHDKNCDYRYRDVTKTLYLHSGASTTAQSSSGAFLWRG